MRTSIHIYILVYIMFLYIIIWVYGILKYIFLPTDYLGGRGGVVWAGDGLCSIPAYYFTPQMVYFSFIYYQLLIVKKYLNSNTVQIFMIQIIVV